MKLISSPVLALLAVGGLIAAPLVISTASRRNTRQQKISDIMSEIEILRAANQTLDIVYAHETEEQRNDRRKDHIRRISDLTCDLIDLSIY